MSTVADISASRPALPLRAGHITIRELIDLYFAYYAGRDSTRVQRLTWWAAQVGEKRLDELSDDDVFAAREVLANGPARYFSGHDADGKAVFRAKGKPRTPATLNRYVAALSALLTWSVKQRLAPRGWVHPCRAIEMRPENNEKTRFLTEDERTRLLLACKASKWSRLNLLVLMALSTGARRGELLGLRFADIDLAHRTAHVGRSKNGDPKVLPLIPSVVELLAEAKGKPGELVFASKRTPSRPCAFVPYWAEALRVAKIRGVTLHTLRHSCASFLAQNGATLGQVADLLGHRSISMSKRYAHYASSDRSALVNRVLGDLR